MKTHSWILSIPILAVAVSAAVLEIPYTGGKQSGVVEILMRPSGSIGGQSDSDIDTIRLSLFTVRLYDKLKVYPAVCGFKVPTLALFDAMSVRQSADISTEWDLFDGHPQDAILIDSATNGDVDGSTGSVKRFAPGFTLFHSGQRNTCSGAEYAMDPKWNRIVFLRGGSGVDYRAKFSFHAKRDTTFGTLPQFQLLTGITLNYVINQNSNDLSGPVALRPAVRSLPEQSRARVDYEFYNPLGIRLDRHPGKYAPALPSSRSARRLRREAP